MARIHRLQQVERLTAADLADDQPVGTETQRGNDQIADRKFPLSVFIGTAPAPFFDSVTV